MQIQRIDHYTIRCTREQLPSLRQFYADVLGLNEGPRADFKFPGHWMYAGGFPLVHLAATSETTGSLSTSTGNLDHIAFRTSDLAATRVRLRQYGIAFRELPVPGMPLHQVFLQDPLGIKLELTFDAAKEAAALS
ncbi:MAG TPA: VOC family protein [Burkholderiaceae bacterium]|jgi:catechol 2,3-dioxygenase-like lactoylglutathione lyase family enzyme|nr:VOC family protein [Burkholderiaceae bacterium]